MLNLVKHEFDDARAMEVFLNDGHRVIKYLITCANREDSDHQHSVGTAFPARLTWKLRKVETKQQTDFKSLIYAHDFKNFANVHTRRRRRGFCYLYHLT